MTTLYQTPTMLPCHMVAPMAQAILALIEPYCEKAVIAGALRRRRDLIKEIRVVVIPKTMIVQHVLFADDEHMILPGFKKALGAYVHKKGDPDTDHQLTYFVHDDRLPTANSCFPLIIDIAQERNFGYKLAKATGPHDLIIKTQASLARKLIVLREKEQLFFNLQSGKRIPITSELQYFDLAGVKYRQPSDRF
jgi:DNA polymerase/3'-5' exonuclease PolX